MIASRISAKDINFTALAKSLGLYSTAALSMTAASIHLWVAPEHLAEWWGYGVFFLMVALAQGLFGVAVLRWPTRPLLLAGIAGNLGIVAFYIISRTAGIPFIGPHAGEVHAAGTLDLISVAAELGLVGLLVVLAGESRKASQYAALGAVLAFAGGAAVHPLHSGIYGAGGLDSAAHWLQTSVLALPLSVLAIWFSTFFSRRVSGFFGVTTGFSARLTWALVTAGTYAAASIPADALAAQHANGSFLEQAGRDAGVTLLAGLVALLVVAALRGTPWEAPRAINFWRPRTLTAVTGLALGVVIVGGPAMIGGVFTSPVQAQTAPPSCSAASYDRSYDVAAINADLPFNRWGDVDPDGQIYVLQQDKEATKNWSRPLAANPANDPAGNRRLRPRPLVIRANAGECVKIDFKNEMNERQWGGRLINPRASMQVRGIAYDAQTSDGGAVGFNDDTTAGIGETKTYFWKMPQEEGLHLFRSQTMTSGEEEDAGSNAHGLYGAIAVELAGSTWTDPVSGKKLYSPDNAAGAAANPANDTSGQSGELYIDAAIQPAGGKSFRESVQLAQDYNEVQPGMVGHGFNYGTEPQRNREKPENLPPDGVGEEVSLSSWGYGDPALVKLASGPGPWKPERDAQGNPVTDPAKVENCNPNNYDGFDSTSCYTSNVMHTNQNDPTKVRYAMAGVAETHVFHMHANQWLANPKETPNFYADPDKAKSSTIDSQTFGPGETFTADLLYGAGSKPGTVGDSIFHCHLYPHFAEGFWSLMRVHDVQEDGKNNTPDGINVRNLQPLPDRAAQAPPTADLKIDGVGTDNPGYPRFVPGEFGWRAPQAPDSILEPDPTTADPDDKRKATRIVAGKPLDIAKLDTTNPLESGLAEKLKAEAAAQKMLNKGRTPKPGAPFTEPCETGAREVTYNVSVMQRDVVYNEAGWHDTQGRFLVLDKDVQTMLEKNADGTYKHQPEPLFARVNAGDCVNFNLTNLLPNWFGNDAFVKLIQTNMMGQHIHLVKFDVLASDGSTNGWNYQQAAFTREQMEFNNKVVAGEQPCNKTAGCTVPKPTDWNPSWGKGMEPGQTIQERWYADYELKTVFSHDHHFAAVDQNRGQFAGLLVEPENTNFRNPKTGQFYQPGNGNVPGAPTCPQTGCEGDAVGSAMDVIGPGPKDDFREFGLAFQDFVSLTRKGGDPTNRADVFVGPNAPEDYPDADPGIVGINYRNAPFPLRQEKNGQPTDPAHVFSSTVHGDPATPVMQAYAEDPVQVRLIQGSQEHQHVFDMHGMRWNEDPNNPNSPLVNTQDIGISEAFSFKVPRIECGPTDTKCIGDYLYSSTNVDDLYMGMWGLLRARGERVPSLLPLPDNASPNEPTNSTAPTTTVPTSEGAPFTGSGGTPPESNAPGTPCAPDAPIKKFNVVAMEAKLQYNKDGDHDPYGLIYALAEDEAAIKAGTKKPEPLVLRANEGDCMEVRLTNNLKPTWLQHGNGKAGIDGDAMSPLEQEGVGVRAGMRVSLHPQIVKYDVRGSDGTAVGYNRDQTVAPGDSKLYRWYADEVGTGEIGATNMTDFGDVRGHRHHGLFAGLNIEPKGATYHDPQTGEQIKSGVSADIRLPGAADDFREHTLFFQDGLNLRNKTGAPIEGIPDPGEPAGPANDHIDQGEKGFNYASAQFHHRFGGREAGDATPENPMNGQEMSNVYNSKIHGDPATPIFRSYAGDDVRMRVLQGADKQRQNVFEQLGHAWRQFPDDPNSPLLSAQGGFSVGRSLNINLSSAGNGFAGDYRYANGMYRHHLSGGQWGISRVYPQPSAATALNPTPIGNVDDPRAGGHPLMPLEIVQSPTSISLGTSPAVIDFGKTTTVSGKLTKNGTPVAGESVKLEQKPAGAANFGPMPTAQATAKTNAQGSFSFAGVKPLKKTEYRVSFAGDAGLRSTASVTNVRVKALVSLNAATQGLKLGKSRTISGAVAPAHTGTVKLTIKRNGKQVLSKSLPLKSSRYSYSYKPRAAGSYSVVASFAGDADHLGGGSPVKIFKVTR